MMFSLALQAQDFQAYGSTADDRLYGLNFSPNFQPLEHRPSAEAAIVELEHWVRIVAPYTHWIKTFDTRNRMANAGKVAHALNLKIAVGAWLGPERNDAERVANEQSVARLIALGQRQQMDLAIVGSEILYRGDLFPEQLLGYIQKVKEALPDVPVTTADTYTYLLDHPEILASVDTVFMNHYAYWEGIPIEQAIPALHSAYQDLVNAAQGKPIIVSESGWPSCGDNKGEAVASLENAKTYLAEFLAWARANQVRYFYFEAFDEPWKAQIEGPQGACWGLWDKDGKLKPGLNSVFNSQDPPPLEEANAADLANTQTE